MRARAEQKEKGSFAFCIIIAWEKVGIHSEMKPGFGFQRKKKIYIYTHTRRQLFPISAEPVLETRYYSQKSERLYNMGNRYI